MIIRDYCHLDSCFSFSSSLFSLFIDFELLPNQKNSRRKNDMISYNFRNNIYSNTQQKISQNLKNQKSKSNLIKERRQDLSSIQIMIRQRSKQAQFKHLRLVIFLLLLKIFMMKNQKKKSQRKTKSQRNKNLQKLNKRVIKRRFPKSKHSHIRLIRHL